MNDKEKQFQEFINKARTVGLLRHEKEDLKNIIIKRINDVSISRQSREFINRGDFFGQSLLKRLFHQRQRRAYAYSIGLFLLIVLGASSVSAYAERSLPGEPLYNLKVNFNEKIAAFFLTSPIDKANRESSLVEKRFEEAHELTLKGKLSAASREIVEQQLDKHTEKINDYLKIFQAEKEFGHAAEIQIRLEVALMAGEKLLSKAGNLSAEITPFAAKVKNELTNISSNRADLHKSLAEETKNDLSVISGERQRMAQSAYAGIERLVQENKSSLFANDYRKLASRAHDDLISAQKLMNALLYKEAIVLFDEVFRLYREAEILSETQKIEYNRAGFRDDSSGEEYLKLHSLSFEDLELFPNYEINSSKETATEETEEPTSPANTIKNELPGRAGSSVIKPKASAQKFVPSDN